MDTEGNHESLWACELTDGFDECCAAYPKQQPLLANPSPDLGYIAHQLAGLLSFPARDVYKILSLDIKRLYIATWSMNPAALTLHFPWCTDHVQVTSTFENFSISLPRKPPMMAPGTCYARTPYLAAIPCWCFFPDAEPPDHHRLPTLPLNTRATDTFPTIRLPDLLIIEIHLSARYKITSSTKHSASIDIFVTPSADSCIPHSTRSSPPLSDQHIVIL